MLSTPFSFLINFPSFLSVSYVDSTETTAAYVLSTFFTSCFDGGFHLFVYKLSQSLSHVFELIAKVKVFYLLGHVRHCSASYEFISLVFVHAFIAEKHNVVSKIYYPVEGGRGKSCANCRHVYMTVAGNACICFLLCLYWLVTGLTIFSHLFHKL